jgi:hypothetical protein
MSTTSYGKDFFHVSNYSTWTTEKKNNKALITVMLAFQFKFILA